MLRVEEYRTMVRYMCLDWADDDTRVKELAARVLSPKQISGDGYGFVGVVEIVEKLVERIVELEEGAARAVCSSVDYHVAGE